MYKDGSALKKRLQHSAVLIYANTPGAFSALSFCPIVLALLEIFFPNDPIEIHMLAQLSDFWSIDFFGV